MSDAYIFYNPMAGDGRILEDLDALQFVLDENCVFCDMTKPETYGESLFVMKPEDYLVLCGGDGTLNRFANLTADLERPNEVYYFPAGTHNDFALDFSRHYGDNPFPVGSLLRDLPMLVVGGRRQCFLTGISFQPAGKGAVPELKIVWEGKPLRFSDVFFAAVLYGNHAFGGMRPIPGRSRKDAKLSLLIIHGCSGLRARWILRNLRRGKPLPLSRHISCLEGKQLQLSFSCPVEAVMDGDPQTLQSCIICKESFDP